MNGIASEGCATQLVPSQVHTSAKSSVLHALFASLWYPLHPPVMTILPRAASYTIACVPRAGGEIVGVTSVQSVPSHSHVSASDLPSMRPPNSTIRLRTGSNAIAWPPRAGGTVAGESCVHVVPSHAHVSAS